MRVSSISNPGEKWKCIILRKRNARERRKKKEAMRQVRLLTESLQITEEELANVKDSAFERKCEELNIVPTQKTVLHEILKTAKRTDSRGRRYTHEWIMLCVLMNIRSPSNYQFLRKNNVLLLPCARTVRDYIGLMNSKCGFDQQFAELLKKYLSKKQPLERHGILLLDEINLRKSVAVCSKNLTYIGLTDLGEGGQQSTDINDQQRTD